VQCGLFFSDETNKICLDPMSFGRKDDFLRKMMVFGKESMSSAGTWWFPPENEQKVY